MAIKIQNTAESVLTISRQDLIRRTDLEEETIDDVLTILNAEFAEEDDSDESDDKKEAQEQPISCFAFRVPR